MQSPWGSVFVYHALEFLGDVGSGLIIPRRVEPGHISPPRSLLGGDGLLSVLELVIVPEAFRALLYTADSASKTSLEDRSERGIFIVALF